MAPDRPDEEAEFDDRYKLEFRYAWDWFSYHAKQRLTAFNFFLILTGAIIVGYTQAVAGDQKLVGIALGLFGVIVAVAFWVMDVRNAELVNYGLTALDRLETDLRVEIRTEDTTRKQFDKSGGPLTHLLVLLIKKERMKHTVWLRAVIFLVGVFSVIGIGWAVADFHGSDQTAEQTIVCKNETTTPCWYVRPSAHRPVGLP